MAIKMTLCPFCLKETAEELCPHCGKPVSYAGETAHLQPGYVLHGQHPYILGTALGQGGFGITYIALDMVTNERVAIKEYYPTYCAIRSNQQTVTFYRGQEEVYNKGRDRFLDEARVLKSLSDLKSIVNVLDFFELNNSAYLVMEFLEGDSLKSYALKNGKFPAQTFLKQLRPLMEDIERMHQRGVVHRDIAPDNIILTPDGQMKLIDFGAARSYVGDKSMTVVVKKGFAPIEQYMRHGSTAATDVYALAATIYYCITGTVPPDSAERQYDEDMLKSPISLGAELSREQERAIVKALEVQPKKRTQTVAELLKALEHAPKPEKPKPVKKSEKPKAEPKRKQKWMIPVVAAVLFCIVGGVLFLGKESPAAPVESEPMQVAVPETTIPETEPPVILSEEAQKYNEAVDFFNNGEYGKAAIAFAKLGDYRDAKEISLKIWDAIADRKTVVCSASGFVAVKEDGTVYSFDGAPKLKDWTDIIAVDYSSGVWCGLRSDGTVVYFSSYDHDRNIVIEEEGWLDIVSISFRTDAPYGIIGLKADGTVVVMSQDELLETDFDSDEQETSYHEVFSGLQEVIWIRGTLLKTADGVLKTGGIWEDGKIQPFEISEQQDVVDEGRGVLLKADGTVCVDDPGKYDSSILKKTWETYKDVYTKTSRWENIVAIDGDSYSLVGLKADGKLVGAGFNWHGYFDFDDWTDIVMFTKDTTYVVGLTSDGRLKVSGPNAYERGKAESKWVNMKVPADRDALLTAIELNYITEE